MLSKLSNIQKDKLLHFFWGAILSFILMIPFGIVGMIIALIIPAIKELYYDKYLGKGCCEWADYFYKDLFIGNLFEHDGRELLYPT